MAGGPEWELFPAFVSCDSSLLNAFDMNLDGDVVVGLAWIAGCQAHAFRWDPRNGTVDMGTTVPNRSTRANAVNDDGSTIAGWQDQLGGQRRGCKWTELTQSYFPNYQAPGGGSHEVGEALNVNGPGDIVIGYIVFGLGGGTGWKWSAATDTTTLLPQLPGFGGSTLPLGVTDDGTIAVGTTGGFPLGRRAIIWIDDQPQDLKTYVESLGGSIAPYSTLGTAMAITPDGRTIVGWGAGVAGEPSGWVVQLPGACPSDLNGNGQTDGFDLAVLLGAWGTADRAADLDGDGIVDGVDLAMLLGAWGSCN